MARAILKGSPVSPGIAIGPLRLLPNARLFEKRSIKVEEVESEIAALRGASERVRADLRESIDSSGAEMAEYREILAAQMELARDPRIIDGASARIRRRLVCAAWALAETIEELFALFLSMADPYMRDRAQDIRLMGECLSSALLNPGGARKMQGAGILGAYALSPADVMASSRDGARGLLTVDGGATSHTAILARTMKTPALVGVEGLLLNARQGEMVIVDGLGGLALLGPDDEDLARYEKIRKNYLDFEMEARDAASLPAITRDGTLIKVGANLDSQLELGGFLNCGAEEIGLYRTEFSFLGNQLPSEESLVAEYEAIVKGAGTRVVFRVLDVGADKLAAPQEALQEPNPALGLRGIRFCLSREDIFLKQARAFLRAGQLGEIAILLPMITTSGEVRKSKAIIERARAELGGNIRTPALGVMIETPAAVMICGELAEECDFLSIGTNDLLHYLMAIDRNNRHVAYLHDPLHPAFLRSLKHIITCAHGKGREATVCGELAADPFGIALLIGLGIDGLSVAPRFAPGVKHIARKLSAAKCRELALDALSGKDSAQTRLKLGETLRDCLGHELSMHNTIISGKDRS